jgi:multicomponent Na+:H+ antiporter subunit D
VLLFASAGVFHHAGIKIPYFAFFAHDSGRRCAEAPLNMLIAMGAAAVLCVGIGIFPTALYAVLLMPVTYEPYTAGHVLSQLQLLVFSALAFAVLMRTGIYPPELRSVNLDFDWFYRVLLRRIERGAERALGAIRQAVTGSIAAELKRAWRRAQRLHGPRGVLARTWPSGSMALWMMVMLLALLLSEYLL